jgi:hypothetical protein
VLSAQDGAKTAAMRGCIRTSIGRSSGGSRLGAEQT